VHKSEIAVFTIMGMGIAIAWLAVSGPSRMSDAGFCLKILVQTKSLKIAHLSHCLIDIQLAGRSNKGYACTVIASIFKAMQSLYENVIHIAIAYITYYSTHIIIIY
jgi:hypothetical protein